MWCMEKVDYKELGKRIRLYRRKQNLTQEQLACMIDISKKQISNVERAYSAPTLQTFVRICNALGVSPSQLLMDSITVQYPERFARYGLSTKDTLVQLIELYMEYYDRLGNETFLQLAYLYMRTYMESRFDCKEHAELFQRILTATGRGELEKYLLTVNYFCRLVPLTKESIGNILGRWLCGKDRSGKKPEIIEDIRSKVLNREIEKYEYYNNIYGKYQYFYLIINSHGAFMQDNDGEYYKFYSQK